MGLSGQNGLHWGAAKWYYEFVAGYGPGVPEAIVRHVRRCLVCRRQIERLKKAVTGAGGETGRSRSTMKRDVIDTLSLHFGCLEERVTCARVKPFLPGLLMPSVQIRIPTPVTVHIDHCPECADDLKALRDLRLADGQLERLEQLYGCDSLGASPLTGLRTGSVRRAIVSPRLRLGEALRCQRARSAIAAFVGGRLEDIDAETLNHLCTCPRCRLHVHRSRQRLLENESNGTAGTPAVCADEIPMARLFDYAIPYGRTGNVAQPPSAGKSEGSPPGAGVPHDHVGTCRACLRRIQELDETVYGIAERTDSGVATVYSTAEHDAPPQRIVPMHHGMANENHVEDGEAGPVADSFADVYPDYPIHVQVIRGRPQSVVAASAWKRTAFDPRVRFLLKTAVAAAAMIPLALLFLNTRTASGTTLAQMRKAFGKARNIHVLTSYPNTGQITQELWISRATNRVLVTGGQERALYDLGRKKRLSYPTSRTPAGDEDLSDRQYLSLCRSVDTCLGFRLGEIPAGATWTCLPDSVADDIETYELTYTEQGRSDVTLIWRLQIAIDPATRLPREVQIFRRRPGENEWHYLSRTECRYPAEDEMAAILESH